MTAFEKRLATLKIHSFTTRVSVPLTYLEFVQAQCIPDALMKMVEADLAEDELANNGVHVMHYEYGVIGEKASCLRVVISQPLRLIMVNHFKDFVTAKANQFNLN